MLLFTWLCSGRKLCSVSSSQVLCIIFPSRSWCSAATGKEGNSFFIEFGWFAVWKRTAAAENVINVAILVPNGTWSTALSGLKRLLHPSFSPSGLLQAIDKYCRVSGGFSGVKDVYSSNPTYDDVQQSFFLAETLKWVWFEAVSSLTLRHFNLQKSSISWTLPRTKAVDP